MSAVLPADKHAAAPEIAVYLKESVGNATRIDYGTGKGPLFLYFFAFFLACTVEVLVNSVADLLLHVIRALLSRHKIKCHKCSQK